MEHNIVFYGTKPYDKASFDSLNKEYGFDIRYFKGNLNIDNVPDQGLGRDLHLRQ